MRPLLLSLAGLSQGATLAVASGPAVWACPYVVLEFENRGERMALYLTDDEVRRLLPMGECIDVLDDLFRQEIPQLEAVCAVRPVKLIKAFSRTEENRNRFAAEMRERLGVDVMPAATTEECVRGSDIVITITSTREPVLPGALLEPGMHVN